MDLIDIERLYQEVKHKGRKLSQEEISHLAEAVIGYDRHKKKYIVDSILCLSLGSYYFEENPMVLKPIFNIDMFDTYKADLFRAIQYSNIARHYKEEILEHAVLSKFLDDFQVSSKSALYACAQIVYNLKEDHLYQWLYKNYYSSLRVLDLTDDEDTRDEIKDYLTACYYSLLYSLYGNDSKRMAFKIQHVLESGIDLPPQL